MLAAQGTLASLVAAQGLGVHAVVLGTAGAGVYALARPRLRADQASVDAS
jgi:O-acetyl-ADP-ribose deacetylase (regulator of RNase III)